MKHNTSRNLFDFRLTTDRGACGLIRMDGTTGCIVRGGAPIFNNYAGQILLRLVQDKGWTLEPLGKVTREMMIGQGTLFR